MFTSKCDDPFANARKTSGGVSAGAQASCIRAQVTEAGVGPDAQCALADKHLRRSALLEQLAVAAARGRGEDLPVKLHVAPRSRGRLQPEVLRLREAQLMAVTPIPPPPMAPPPPMPPQP